MSNTIDLTQRPPRSPRVRLGGFVHLPRLLDKGRADLAGKLGEYHYNCPMDQHFFNFTGIDAESLKQQLASGKGDGEILEWVLASAPIKHSPYEIAAWSSFVENRGPCDVEMRAFFQEAHSKLAPKREDIVTWFDLLDLDDYVTYGGKA